MATPGRFNANLLPSADDYYDNAIYEVVLSVVQSENMAVLKQQLETYRRKRTNALNAIKDLRQRMADEDLGDDEGNAETLQSLSHQWQDMNLAVKSLEDLEEYYEHLLVLGTEIVRPSRLRPPEVPSEQAQRTSPVAPPISPLGHHSAPDPGGQVLGEQGARTVLTAPFVTPMSTVGHVSAGATLPRASERRRPDSRQVSKVDLPELVEKFSLQHHLTVCKAMMVEAELGDYVQGLFEPFPNLRFSVVNRILTSLKGVGDVHSLATSTAEQQSHNWSAIRQVLLSTFAKRETLLMELRAMVGSMKYSNIDKFCAEVRKVYAMLVRLFGADNQYEIRGFVEAMVARLLASRASALISEIHNTAHLQSYTPDWPLVLPFDGVEASVLGVLNRLERQEVAARALTSKGLSASAEVAAAAIPPRPGKGGSLSSNAPTQGTAVREWCARYPADSLIKVFDLWGDALKQKIPDMLDSFAMRGRKKRFPLFRIVALPKDCDRDSLVNKLKEEGVRADVFAPFT